MFHSPVQRLPNHILCVILHMWAYFSTLKTCIYSFTDCPHPQEFTINYYLVVLVMRINGELTGSVIAFGAVQSERRGFTDTD